MKKFVNLIGLLITVVTLMSCNRKITGTYTTGHLSDKSSFFAIRLNTDGTVDKLELHTISDYAKGRYYLVKNRRLMCVLDTSTSGFHPDTINYKVKGNRLYRIKGGVVDSKMFLKKSNSNKIDILDH